MAVDLADAFERETGIALHERELLGVQMLMPSDDRLGSFGIVVGRTAAAAANLQFATRAYPGGVELIWWGGKELKKVDAALRRITRGAA
jgi:hypothetical protein